jgi:surface protein
MRKKKKIIFILILLLIIGTGIGYAKIESINGNWGFISIRRNRSYQDLMPYTEDTGYYTSEIMAKVKRIIINDDIGDDFTLPDNIQGEVMNVAADGTDSIRAYLVPNADDSTKSDMYIIANGFINLPANSSNLFANFTNLEEFVNPSRLIADKVTNMNSIFKGTKISSLNLASWDVSKVTDFASAFEDVDMVELNIVTWKFNAATDASNMFKNAFVSNLSIGTMEFDGAVNLTSMFEGANTTSIDSKIVAKEKLTGTSMFKGMKITTLKLDNSEILGNESTIEDFALNSEIVNFSGDNWNIPGISSLANTFKNSTKLETFSMKNLKLADSDDYDLSSMFEGCSVLTSANLSKLNGNTKVNMTKMFMGTSVLSTLDLSEITGIKVLNLNSFVKNSSTINEIDLTSLDLSECTDYHDAFVGCEYLLTVRVNNTYTEPTPTEEDSYIFKEVGTTIVTVTGEEPSSGEPEQPEAPTEP